MAGLLGMGMQPGLLSGSSYKDPALDALLGQVRALPAPRPVAPPQRDRVSGWRVFDRVLGGQTVSEGLDAERARLTAEANAPRLAAEQERLRRQAAAFGPAAELAWVGNQEEAAKALASNLEGYTLSAGGVRGGVNGLVAGAPTTTTVNDQIFQNDPLTRTSTLIATADPSFADQTARFNAENPVLPANSTWIGPNGVRATGYIAPEVVSTPQGGTTTVLDAQGRVINSVQGNPDNPTRKSYEDSIGVRRFEDTGEPVFPEDFARIRGQAQSRVTAADQSAANLTRTINEALELSGAGETGAIGAVMGAVPGSKARRLRAVIETIKSNIGFNYLQQMRELSPTGGALGSVAQQELQSLQSVWGNLDPNASEAQLDGVLRQMLSMVEQGRQLRSEAFASQYGQAPPSSGAGGSIPAPQSEAEYNALPSGSQYRYTDGSIRRKP